VSNPPDEIRVRESEEDTSAESARFITDRREAIVEG